MTARIAAQVAKRTHTGGAEPEWPLAWEIMLVFTLSVLGSSVVMRFLDPGSHWVLRTHIFASLAVTAILMVVLARLLEVRPFARR
jgi:hypothetical protein